MNKPDAARQVILNGVRRELLGPAGCGVGLDISMPVVEDDSIPYVDMTSGQEIISIDAPLNRYGLGVLFPKQSVVDDQQAEEADDGQDPDSFSGKIDHPELEQADDQTQSDTDVSVIERRNHRTFHGLSEEESDSDFLETTRRRSSSMAVSFRVNVQGKGRLNLSLPEFEPGTPFPVNGRYQQFRVQATNKKSGGIRTHDWWVRQPITGSALVTIDASVISESRSKLIVEQSIIQHGPLSLEFSAFARRFPGSHEGDLVVTVVLSNRTDSRNIKAGKQSGSSLVDHLCLFQSYFEVSAADPSISFVPLPGSEAADSAAGMLNLIYRNAQAFSVGHGCSTDWRGNSENLVIKATHFPTLEVASMTPDLTFDDGQQLEIAMADLAGLNEASDGLASLELLTTRYAEWLERVSRDSSGLTGWEATQAAEHVSQGHEALRRMQKGLQLLNEDSQTREAFRMMNHAMLLQQVASRSGVRSFVPPSKQDRAHFQPAYTEPSLAVLGRGRGRWRPFQIGFILAALDSTANPSSSDRDLVDVIWFPTGGGKTEAYLGLSAFSAILRRLRDPDDAGTEIIMRYTLRLLTAQQFERASSLVCALEVLRRKDEEALGSSPFSIGLWVGGGTTPNSWKDATDALKKLSGRSESSNPFLITRCPWCGAEMGPAKGAKPLGYRQLAGKVRISCPDNECIFNDQLPIQVVDEDLYERPPTMVIGTVDKFAQLSWRPEPRSFFGLDGTGQRISSPPNLIIQDELHLITGPLGTMVGSFEVVVDHLSSFQTHPNRSPKIVCSTATVRNFQDQIRWLFARNRTSMFPPPMLDINDSFFGVRAKQNDGTPAPGRQYVGIFAPALGSHMSVQIRVYAAALQAVMGLDEAEKRDPYWTLMGFFNTLRDLGSTTTLLKDQIPNHLLAMWRRHGLLTAETQDLKRRIFNVEELTSRLRSDEVPQALNSLSNTLMSGDRVIDVCLASNMIEVGIDVDRLALMVVTGQPKSNSQYIQVTGRVGRDWANRPGLVIVAYAPNRARDRSVFETFRINHERMYAAVEPASVTPYSLPALRRVLHATMVAFVRQRFDAGLTDPSKVSEEELHEFRELVMKRVALVDPEALADAEAVFDDRLNHWMLWRPVAWHDWSDPNNREVLQVPASMRHVDNQDIRWRTPQSMRTVDAASSVNAEVVRSIESVWQKEGKPE